MLVEYRCTDQEWIQQVCEANVLDLKTFFVGGMKISVIIEKMFYS